LYLIQIKIRGFKNSGEGEITSELHGDPTNSEIRQSAEYREWRNAVLRRDNYTCIFCKSKFSIEAHHIYSFAGFPELRFDMTNGLSLCRKCHQLTPNYGSKQKQFDQRLKLKSN
jgi:5-methylcytosine-specific restriction endonuclease McrA